MKLILVFGPVDVEENNSIYFTASEIKGISKERQIIVVPNFSNKIHIRDFADSFRDYVSSNLEDGLVRDAFIANFHNFYFHSFRNIYKWIIAIEEFVASMNEDFSIELTDAVKCNNLNLYGSEGEINELFFYKKYDYIPYVLYDYFKGKNLNVSVKRWRSTILLNIRSFIRRDVLLVGKLTYLIYVRILSVFKKKVFYEQSENALLFLTRSIAHTKAFVGLIPQMDSKNIFVYSEGYYGQGLNYKYFNNSPIASYDLNHFICITDIIKVFCNTFLSIKLIKSKHLECLDNSLLKIRISLYDLLYESVITYFDAVVYSKTVNRIALVHRGGVITGEMFTQYPYSLRKELSSDLKLLQYSDLALGLIPNVKFVYGDNFLFESHNVFKIYCDLNYNESKKYLCWAELGDKLPEIKVPKRINKIIYFSQPFQQKSQTEIVSFLYTYTQKNNGELFVKIHPRDSSLLEYCKNSGIQHQIEINEIDGLLQNYDLAVTRTSSTLNQIIKSNIPFCLPLFTLNERVSYNEYIQMKYVDRYVNIFPSNLKEFQEALIDPETLVQENNEYVNEGKFLNLTSLSSKRYSNLNEYFLQD